jgi:uncharacterized protein YycO
MKPAFRLLSFSALLVPLLLLNNCSGQTPNNTGASNKIQTAKIDSSFHDGDIIFQTSHSGQSYAIQLATHSTYSHCGLLFKDDGQWYVYEAVQPVSKTPLNKWIARGDSGIYVVKRLKNADSLLTTSALVKMRYSVHKKMGKNYDPWFGWGDDRIYCSELVWKAYHDATGLSVGELKKLGDYDLSNPIVKKKLNERYGNKIPLEEPMISPGNIFNSDLLVTVREKH